MQSGAKDNTKNGLTQDEKVLLKPFFDRLKTIGVHEVSDILLVLNEMPTGSENIKALIQQITDAAFATNAKLYYLIINQ